jgi:hypothetical protein
MIVFFQITMILLFASAFTPTAKVSHSVWDRILKDHVSSVGVVNYKKLQRNKTLLDQYLKELSANPPQTGWSENERKTYWINAYNAFTISLVLQHYPIKSIKDIGGFFKSPWDLEFITIGNEKYTLNRIEHEILRKEFNDPRIHFAIVCASRSCPILLSEAYIPQQLDKQLDQQTRVFLADSFRNRISANTVVVSKIFDWFNEDFTANGTLIQFLNRYSRIQINDNASVSYLDYDWSLNE